MGIHSIIGQEIAFARTDVIINASNGCGWMGGSLSKKILCSGVAEHLNYYTHGKIESESKIKARRYAHISAWLFGTAPGKIFVTSSCGLECKEVIHAVTMRFPGTLSSYKSVNSCLNKIFAYCREKGHHSISMPLLGCGTGRLKGKEVFGLIQQTAEKYNEIQVFVYSLKEIN